MFGAWAVEWVYSIAAETHYTEERGIDNMNRDNGVTQNQIRCGNEPDDCILSSTTKVTGVSWIRTSDRFGVMGA